MPFHQLVIELGRADPADAGDQALLEPAPGETPLWRETRLCALFADSAQPAVLAATLTAVLGLPGDAIRCERVADRLWEREWLKDFRPMRFGRRLWVCPAGQPPGSAAATVLELDPGLAFGTGTHPTTALCLEWLDEAVAGDERVLDYGCGSGILALAALRLGARAASAFDIDPQALQATRENAIKNDLDGRIEIADRAEALGDGFDIVLANILSGPLIALAPGLAARTRTGGALVLAGLLERQSGEVAQAYQPWFDIGPVAERDGWTLLAGRRRAE